MECVISIRYTQRAYHAMLCYTRQVRTAEKTFVNGTCRKDTIELCTKMPYKEYYSTYPSVDLTLPDVTRICLNATEKVTGFVKYLP